MLSFYQISNFSDWNIVDQLWQVKTDSWAAVRLVYLHAEGGAYKEVRLTDYIFMKNLSIKVV